MSDRPEDYPESQEAEPVPTASAAEPEQGPTQGPGDAPWWHEPHAGHPWGSYPPASHDPSYGPGYGPGGPQDPYGRGQSRPSDPYGYGPGYGQGGAAGPGGPTGGQPGAWYGGHWSAGPWAWNQPEGGWGQPAQTPDAQRRRKRLAMAAAAGFTALALLLGIGIGYGVWNGATTPTASHAFLPGGTSRSTSTGTSTSSTGKISSATGAPSDISTIAAKVTPGLVDINTVLGYETEEAAGTGMVLTPTGKVLTNNHVIEGSTKITATDLGNGKVYQASVLGYTRTHDVAVIQLKGASGLKTVHIGNSSSLKVGSAVVGIGNAGGVGGKPSAAGGSVTALNQAITASDQGSLGITTEHLTGLVESNANIQPGDSGGPLVTTSGSVVGMDTAASSVQGYTFRGAATGQGYSIPINTAISLAHQIIAGSQTAAVHIGGTPFLGVYVVASTTRTRAGFGFGSTPATTTSTSNTPASVSGAVVRNIIPGTPAQGSGLSAGDVITGVAGTKVTSPSDLTKVMLQYHPGDAVKVDWTTPSGQAESATITLGNGPAD